MTFKPTGTPAPEVDGTRKVQTVNATVQVNTVLSAAGFQLPSSPITFDYARDSGGAVGWRNGLRARPWP